jgi:hypothetical protein
LTCSLPTSGLLPLMQRLLHRHVAVSPQVLADLLVAGQAHLSKPQKRQTRRTRWRRRFDVAVVHGR